MLVKQTTGQPSNGAILSDIARQFGFDRVKPIQMYINKLVKKGRLPQELATQYEVDDMEEDFQLDEKIAGLVKSLKSLKYHMVFSKRFTIVEWSMENRTQTRHYTTTMGVCKSELILNRRWCKKSRCRSVVKGKC